MDIEFWQWALVIAWGLILFFLSPWAKTTRAFFKGAGKNQKKPNSLLLAGSLIISWIFAKSITNAANLGMEYGIVGGVAYSGYYFSFAVAGIVIFKMRTKGGFKSLHHFLTSKFGKAAMALFSILIAIRLFNEVWSNTMVIGSYFGDIGSTPFYIAVFIFTFLTLAYTLKGGLSSSIFSDAIQMCLFSVLLCVVLWSVFSVEDFTVKDVATSGSWQFDMGLNLLLVALIQSFSYPFHDPVLTDLGFVSSPKTTRKAFLWSALLGGLCIALFSIVGIFAQKQGLRGQAAVEVGKAFGVVVLLVINLIMITSASSTLDSTFSSFSKLLSVDLGLGKNLTFGRLSMAAVAVLGTIPVFFDPEILSATTISGSMVIGLAPVFVFWRVKAPKSSFFLSVFAGLACGFLLVFEMVPEILVLTQGEYAPLLWINLWGLLVCVLFYWIPIWMKKFSI